MSAAHAPSPVELVLDRLHAAGCNPKQSRPGQWNARCPVADTHKRGDRNPSLSVAEGVDGKALVTCHTGCSLPEIARQLDLALHDLFPSSPAVSHIEGGRRVKATYPYYDLDGQLIFEVVRYDPKTFRQRRPTADGGWVWNLQGVGRYPLYHAPQVAAAIADGRTVWVVEGEKDAEALQWVVDGATTCNSGGAGSWRPEHTEALTGATLVHVVHDADEKGLQHARSVAKALCTAGVHVIVSRPPEGFKDIAEALGAGRGVDDLEHVWDSTGETDMPDDSDWAPIDLAGIAAAMRTGDYQQITPTVLNVEGATPLLYAERINSLFGESGGGKTWVALAAVADVVRAGDRALFIDYEDTPAGIAERLVLLGLTDDEIGRVDYRNPSTGIGIGIEHLTTQAVAGTYKLVVLDSTGEAMASGAVNPNADEEVAMWFRRVKELTRLPGAPAVVVLDHVPKATDAPASYAIGSQRKRAAVTGASYRVDTLKEPAKGRDGKLRLTVAKDRPGNRAKGTTAAIVDITSHDAGELTMRFHISDAQAAQEAGERWRPTIYMERISRWLEVHPGATKRTMIAEVTGKREVLETAFGVLCDEGWITVEDGPRNANLCHVVRSFRESEPVDNSDNDPPVHRGPTAAPPRPDTGGDDPCTAAPPLLGGRGGYTGGDPQQLQPVDNSEGRGHQQPDYSQPAQPDEELF